MPINVFLVDDSATVRTVLKLILEKDPEICVLGVAANAEIALKKMAKQWPDVIVSDLEMPGMHGLDFLKYIKANRPTPFVVCSSHVGPGAKASIDALALGAVDIIAKPNIGVESYLEEITAAITQSVKAAACVGTRHTPATPVRKLEPITPRPIEVTTPRGQRGISVIAIGSSTGGTAIVEHLLKHMTPSTPGVLIVQHMPKHFTELFAKRLNTVCPIEVKEAEDGDAVRNGRALIAPGGTHMKLSGQGNNFFVTVCDDPPVNRHKPSVDVLFRSVASHAGARSLGIILTGMGEDGATGLLEMRRAGAASIGQDQASSAVYGMPRVAMEIGAVEWQMPYVAMPDFIQKMLDNTKI
ncbi:MAG TPA: chemotaxis response regulator protein-glutamate methylesterase [Pseudomonadales bacterium]|nr:chemotaxis response regulator protein-glutamate methylesterase [Pseudomonadales bacterium]